MNSDLLDEQMHRKVENMSSEQLEQLINQLLDRMQQEEYISIDQPHDPARQSSVGGQVGETQAQVNLRSPTRASTLGFKALRDLLGSLGKSNFGRHDTRDMATGIEASGASKTYEFGDTLNLDITATLSSAIQREGLHLPLNIEYRDLQVHQCEYQSSCATVLMLDCSHSMILYEKRDRFTPAKKVAMALSHSNTSRSIRRLAIAGAVPRFRRRVAAVATGAREGRPRITPTRVKACAWRSGFFSGSEKDMKQKS